MPYRIGPEGITHVELLAELLRGMKRQRKVQDKVDRCLAAGRCLIEGCDRSNDEKGGARGLCAKHFQAHARSMLNRTMEDKMAREIKAVRAGHLLEKHEIRRATARAEKAAS